MRYLWLVPLLAFACGCKQEEARPERSAPAAPPRAAAHPADPRPVIACFGDSLTAGFGVDPGHSYPDLLQQELDRRGYHYHVVNLGESGDTTQDGLDRMSLVMADKPRITIVEFGANDGLRGQPVSNMENNLSQMIDTFQKAGIRVVLAGITLPPNYGPDYIRHFDAVYPPSPPAITFPVFRFCSQGR